jgi:hypothetical protein
VRILSIIFIFLFATCGPKHKGKVKVNAVILNTSSEKLVILNKESGATDTIRTNEAYSFAHDIIYRSRSKPLCCPCAGRTENFEVTPADTSRKLVKDINDPLLWERTTEIRLDYWSCRITVTDADLQFK